MIGLPRLLVLAALISSGTAFLSLAPCKQVSGKVISRFVF